MDELLRAIAEHLRGLGYSIQVEDGVVKASHPERFNFWVLPLGEGALFRTLFRPGPEADRSPSEFLAFVNRANIDAIVSRFLARDGLLAVEAWFPNTYENNAFSTFFNQYLSEISDRARRDAVAANRFFPPEPEATR